MFAKSELCEITPSGVTHFNVPQIPHFSYEFATQQRWDLETHHTTQITRLSRKNVELFLNPLDNKQKNVVKSPNNSGKMRAMNRNDLAKSLANSRNMTIPEMDAILTELFEYITLVLSCDENVRIKGFGNFEPYDRPETTRKHPLTREEVIVEKEKRVKFIASPTMKRKLNND